MSTLSEHDRFGLTRRPPCVRSEDDRGGCFVAPLLTRKSWPTGRKIRRNSGSFMHGGRPTGRWELAMTGAGNDRWAMTSEANRASTRTYPVLTRQCRKQRARRREVRRVKPFTEATVDRRKHIPRLARPVLTKPQASEADRGAQFPELGVLSSGHLKRASEAMFSRRHGPARRLPRQHRPVKPMQFGIEPGLAAAFRLRQRRGDRGARFGEQPRPDQRFRHPGHAFSMADDPS